MHFDILKNIVLSRKNPIILDKLDRFIFFPNNKVCQTSIARVALRDRAIIYKDDNNEWSHKLLQVTASYFSHIFSFTVVRNPYDRAVSAFHYLKSEGIIDPEFTFTGFCFDVLKKEGTSFDPHFDPQSDGLFCEGRLITDYIAHFERIEKEWRKIARKIKTSRKLPHANKSVDKMKYHNYYDEFSRELISELYVNDIKNFSYKFL